VISLTVLVNTLYLTVMQLVNFSIRGALAAPSFSAVRKMLTAQEVEDAPPGTALSGGEIRFENVTFRYSPQGPPVLQNGTFTIEPGAFAAIVGQTGSGKTTLFHLLLRLLEPTEGRVCIGGKDLRQVPLAELRQFVGFIPQNPFMFDASIRENILMATEQEEGVEEEHLAEAVETARLTDLIQRRQREGGLDAPVGVGGATLSGGERQRLALARILIRDPQVIICDEYTANIDNATARLIHDALAERFAGKTRVVITHQLYSIRGADQILLLDRGQIVDQGTHEELLARGGLYKEMWEVQRLD
jgi:ABC-type multidrug transport system fused ATPase/permease subunit